MSHTKDEVEFTLKVVINKHATKVLFAEIDSNFADVLLSFLTLPLGTIIRLVENQYEEADIGSLTSLYNGLSNLDSRHFSTEGVKMTLLNPRSSFEAEYRKLKLDINDTKPTKYYACQDLDCVSSRESNICMYYDTAVCDCGQPVAREFYYMTTLDSAAYDDGGVFTRNGAYFLISDDLQMVPSVEGSVMETLSILGITDMDGAQLRNVAFGFNKVIDLLKGSLLSSTPLSDIILGENRKYYSEEKPPVGRVLFHGTEKEATTSSNSKKMILKLMLKKSTNELLFAQCEEDFIDFLFSLLTIPLGGVENLLGGNTCLKNIDNLYTSLENINGDKYLRNPDTKGRLINLMMLKCSSPRVV
ncbi:hypothetical protein MIMGU_mgv1a023826mg [Erythranthe guttata]|uniref:DUF674 domain-containing protein n=1 Tax=Erythranthe guttata TaxID=4155 RepID=A0A022QZY5_ERYGU|nr:hypothetical protein MIMGU_mgv1a023826mg [Erythranthe guttata]